MPELLPLDHVFPKPPSIKETPQQIARRSPLQLIAEYIKHTEEGIKVFNATKRPEIEWLGTVKKVIYAAIIITALAMPLSSSFFPGWLTYGVGIPTLLILGILTGRVSEEIEINELPYKALLLIRGMLKESAVNISYPICEQLLDPDPRLPSERIKELKKENLKALLKQFDDHAGDKLTISGLDLDAVAMLKKLAGSYLAHLPDFTSDWKLIRDAVAEARNDLREGEISDYKRQMGTASEAALMIGDYPLHLAALPPPSAKHAVYSFVQKYQHFIRTYEALCRLYEEAQLFFGEDFCGEEWDKYQKKIAILREQMMPFILLFGTKNPDPQLWLLRAREIKEQNLLAKMSLWIEDARGLSKKFQLKIDDHPFMLAEAFKEELAGSDQRILSRQMLDDLQKWVGSHPKGAKNPIGKVLRQLLRPGLSHKINLCELIDEHPHDANRSVREKVQLLQVLDELQTWIDEYPGKANHLVREVVPHLHGQALDNFQKWVDEHPAEANRPVREVVQHLHDQILEELQKWIEEHPGEAKRPAREAVQYLQGQTRDDFQKWINEHPNGANRGIGKVIQQILHSRKMKTHVEEIKTWLNANRGLISAPVIEVLERNCLMRTKFESAKEAALKWDQFGKELKMMPEIQEMQEDEIPGLKAELAEAIKIAPSNEDLQAFKEDSLVPLREIIGCRGEPFLLKRFFRKQPALPFDPVEIPPLVNGKGNFARGRKIEDHVYQNLLKRLDRELILINRIRNYGVEWAVLTGVVILGAIFHSNPWVSWGFAASVILVHAVSLLIIQKLHKKNRKKQEIKQRSGVLNNYPDIRRIPGDRESLYPLSRLQKALCLEGMHTWERVLEKGDRVLDRDLSEIVEKGINKVKVALDRWYKDPQHERPLKRQLSKPEERQINIFAKDMNDAIEARQRIQESLDRIAEETKQLEEEVSYCYNQGTKIFQKISRNRSDPDLQTMHLKRTRWRKICQDGDPKTFPLINQVPSAIEVLEFEFLEKMHSILEEDLKSNIETEKNLKAGPCSQQDFAAIEQLELDRLQIQRLKHHLKNLQEKAEKRLESLQEPDALSFNLLQAFKQIKENNASYKQTKALAKAQAKEKLNGVLLAMEKQLIQLDPKISEMRKEAFMKGKELTTLRMARMALEVLVGGCKDQKELEKARKNLETLIKNCKKLEELIEGCEEQEALMKVCKEIKDKDKDLEKSLIKQTKHMNRHVPEIENKRQALIKHSLKYKEDEKIYTQLNQNLKNLNDLLRQKKEELAKELIQASSERRKADLQQWDQKLDKIKRKVWTESPDRTSDPFIVQHSLIEARLDEEKRIVEALKQPANPDLKYLLNV